MKFSKLMILPSVLGYHVGRIATDELGSYAYSYDGKFFETHRKANEHLNKIREKMISKVESVKEVIITPEAFVTLGVFDIQRGMEYHAAGEFTIEVDSLQSVFISDMGIPFRLTTDLQRDITMIDLFTVDLTFADLWRVS